MDIDAPDYLAESPVKVPNKKEPKPTKRPQNSAHHGGRPSKRRDLLEYAIELAEEQGPKGFTVDSLCDRAGMSKGGIFYHFTSVSELIHEMFVLYLNIKLPQWLNDQVLLTRRTDLALTNLSIEELIQLIQYAPISANLERLMLKTTIESSQSPSATSYLRKLVNESSPMQSVKLYSAFGARIAKVLELTEATVEESSPV